MESLRNKKKFFVNNETYLLYELTVNDIFILYHSVDFLTVEDEERLFSVLLESLPLLESITNCPWKLIVELGGSKIKEIYDLFLEVNKQFFGNNKKRKSNKDVDHKDYITTLFSLCCGLIEAGHIDVLHYGYSFFLKAINNHEKLRCFKLADEATAFRAAYHSDDKQWKKYIRSLVG